MAASKRFFEWYLNVLPAESGQDTQWRWSVEPPWPTATPPWLVVAGGITLFVLIVFVYRLDARRLSLRARCLLISLRLMTVVLVLMFLSGASLLIERIGLPVVALVVDTSASMGLEDRYSDSNTAARAKELVGRAPPTRLNLVKGLLLSKQARWLRDLTSRFQLRVYTFDDGVEAIGGLEAVDGERLDTLTPLLSNLRPRGEQTRPGPALRQVLQDFRGSPPSAIIVFSDGITSTTASERFTAAAPVAKRQLVPIFTVASGSREPARDLNLAGLQMDEVAFVDDPLILSARLKAFGFSGRPVTLTLKTTENDEPLITQTLTAEADGVSQPVDLTWTPTQEGDWDLVLEAEALPGETNRANNRQVHHVRVRRERVRVLLVDGHPRWEYRYVKHLLERSPSVTLTCVLQDADPEYVQDDLVAREHFPATREALFEYDVVILGDINPRFLSSGIMQNLSDFVGEARGGIMLVAGPTYNPIAFRGTPLEALVPADLSTVRLPHPTTEPRDWKPRLTIQGQEWTTLFHLGDSPGASRRIVDSLPRFHWLIELPRLKPGAVSLLECTDTGNGKQATPAILLQHFGSGTVLFHATDDLWLWRFRSTDQYYGRYWLQAIRFLGRGRLLGQTRAAELTTARSEFTRGDLVRLQLRFFDTRSIPAASDPPVVRVQQRGGSFRDIVLASPDGNPGIFSGQLETPGPGNFHAWVRSPVFPDSPPTVDFRVTLPNRELQQRVVDLDELKRTAKLTHGDFSHITSARQLPMALPPGHPVPLATDAPIRLWNRWECLVLFASCLLAEWLWRRRWRLV